MPIKFTTAEKRDELAKRLAHISNVMFDAMSQGHNGQMSVSPEMAEDIMTAAGVVKLCEVAINSKDSKK